MADEGTGKEFQAFLDQNQYTARGILKYEKIFGRGFVSTGGLESTQVNNDNLMKMKLLLYTELTSE